VIRSQLLLRLRKPTAGWSGGRPQATLKGVEKLLTAAAPGGGGPGEEESSPGLTSHPLARAIAVPTGRDAAPSSGNVRHPAAAQ
jgi:hypothetical protein